MAIGEKETEEIAVPDISLEDAVAILNDLPEEGDAPVNVTENTQEDMDELFGLLADLDVDLNEEEPEELHESEPEMQMDEEPAEDTSEESLGTDDLLAVMMEEEKVPEEGMDVSLMTDKLGTEEPLLEALQQEETVASEPVTDEAAEGDVDISMDGLAVEDIFQDALSAVAYSENEQGEDEDLFSIGEMPDLLGDTEGEMLDSVENQPDASEQNKEKKTGFFKRVFGNIITDSTADEEERERQKEVELQLKKEEAKIEKKKKAEEAKAEKATRASEEKERKNQLKQEKALKKAEKKQAKKEAKEAEADHEVVGRINPLGATIVAILFVTVGVAAVFTTYRIQHGGFVQKAQNYFANEDYIRAYDTVVDEDLQDDDPVLYRRIRICSQVQKELNSYKNYLAMGKKTESLDSLIKGMRFYEQNKSEAQELSIQPAYDKLNKKLLEGLAQSFGLGDRDAKSLMAIQDQAQYTLQIQQLASAGMDSTQM